MVQQIQKFFAQPIWVGRGKRSPHAFVFFTVAAEDRMGFFGIHANRFASAPKNIELVEFNVDPKNTSRFLPGHVESTIMNQSFRFPL